MNLKDNEVVSELHDIADDVVQDIENYDGNKNFVPYLERLKILKQIIINKQNNVVV